MKNSNLLNLMMAILLCLAATTAKAQLEVKVAPVDLIFNSPKISGEYIVNDEIGIELLMGFKYGSPIPNVLDSEAKRKGYSLRLAGKYYFNSKNKADRFYAGLYAGPKSISVLRDLDSDVQDNEHAFTAGLITGYKWVGKSGIIFELATGMGRKFVDNTNDDFIYIPVDAFCRVTIGYRF